MRKTKLFRIPLWLITGIAIFFLASAIYDFLVFDRSIIRYALMIGSGIVLLLALGLHLVPGKYLFNQFRKQMGG